MQLIEHFLRAAEREPQRVAFVQPDGTKLTYRDAAIAVEEVASALLANSVERGSTVAVFSANDARAFIAMLGVIRAGAVWVSLNPRNTVADNIALADTTDAVLLFFQSKFEDAVGLIREACTKLSQCVCLDAESRLGPSLEAFRALGAEPAPRLDEDNERACNIFATGGTTGRSKGAVWPNRTWETLVANFWTCTDHGRHPVHLCVAPMTHGAGILAMMLMPGAATNVLLTSAEPHDILHAIETHRVTHLFLPPTLLYRVLSYPKLEQADTTSLTFFLISAAPVSADKLREAVRAFGPVMCQSYGQAEAPFFAAFLSADDHRRALESEEDARLLRSCGRATMFTRLEIMSESGELLPPNTVGEIVLRGNLRMAGYYKDPSATAATLAFGWHHTGDVGYQDERGFFYIVDRKRDIIISGGFNVYSTEVEAALLAHPAVMDCAVIGTPDETWGEAVTAIVELKAGAAVSVADLTGHCRARLGGVKCPKKIEIWESLPRSPVGKVLKRAVRDRFWVGRDRAV